MFIQYWSFQNLPDAKGDYVKVDVLLSDSVKSKWRPKNLPCVTMLSQTSWKGEAS